MDNEHLPNWMQTAPMRQAMNTLTAFSEKEHEYDRYQARLEYQRIQRTIEYELEKAQQEKERIFQEKERILQEKEAIEKAKEAEIERLKALLKQQSQN